LLGRLFGLLFFTTGEVLRCAGTLGRHRVRWWEGTGEMLDGQGNWLSWLLGIAFWAAAVGALYSWVL